MLEGQLAELSARYPGVVALPMAGGAFFVTVPNVGTGQGWSKPRTGIRFVVPQGYPYSNLDCFWADDDLRLAGGGMPQSANITPHPEGGGSGLWFSWHLSAPWNPSRDTLLTWLAVIGERFRAAR